MEIFNKEEVYDSEISPLMKQIIEICNKHGIPMIASFTYENCLDRGPGRVTSLINNIENRGDEVNQKARDIIMNGGHETFSFVIQKRA